MRLEVYFVELIFFLFLFVFLVVLFVDGFDLVTYQTEVVFQLLNLTVHFVYQTAAFLARYTEETDVVFVGNNKSLEYGRTN